MPSHRIHDRNPAFAHVLIHQRLFGIHVVVRLPGRKPFRHAEVVTRSLLKESLELVPTLGAHRPAQAGQLVKRRKLPASAREIQSIEV